MEIFHRHSMSFERLKVPLPGMELGHINVYVFRCSDGYVLIDAGLATYDAALALIRGLKSLGVKLSEISKVFITHLHADHITLVQFLSEVASPDFYIGKEELRDTITSFDEFINKYIDEYKRHGVPADILEAFLKLHPMSRFRKAYEDIWKLNWKGVGDGEKVGCGLEAVWTPGHTPGHTVYVTKFGIFTGDHVLPKITPNISWYPRPGFNPLKEYLSSLKKVDLKTRGFPAHGDEIPNLSARVSELLKHHERRLNEILKVLQEPLTTYQVAKRISWDAGAFDQFNAYNKIFAIGEALSHLIYLEEAGVIRRVEKEVVYWVRL
ncbi:beta-lactamase domain protein [Pyrobaculum islandicum DSM 4184]|uniref:Beta-lactamase domain protein n=2 Tax=Pyrobaculum islandicum TaxID=2277 RepID=A1RVP4_PYRIL|nr:beta-lactamase domain protein [Pyrobaculum islandicum DSM 4184]